MSRYSVDYSHWSDSKYVPDDEATREEIEERRRTEKERNSAQFEKANRGFCEQFKRDAKEREERRREKEDEARALRLKGNVRYKKGNYEGALGVYLRALAAEPYSLPVLSNLSLTCSKLGWWDDSLEYSDRAVHVSRGGRNGIADGPDRAAARAKALYRRAAANAALGRRGDALRDLDACLALDPRNEEAAGRRAAALRDAEEERAEERVRDAMKMILGTSGEPPRCGEGASPGLSEAVIGPASAADAEAYVERDPTLLYQKVMKCVMCGDGDSDGAALRNICGAIDSIMEELRRGGPGARLSCIPSLGDGIARNADAFQSVPAGLRLADNTAAAGATPADLLCLILRLRPLARAYLRTSGYLAQLCQDAAGSDEGAAKAVRPSNDKAVRPSNDEAGGYEFSMDRCLRYHILAEAIQDEGRSRDVLAEVSDRLDPPFGSERVGKQPSHSHHICCLLQLATCSTSARSTVCGHRFGVAQVQRTLW
uniref:Uncharacterized protein n=2 Tax=Odontella aurita TaxID=265563 RepID=A0A7S4K700_9STRA|mmetsp:Transcript_63128/g.186532  ORF Transcript_63128/g.186532 Transcript_63128/m.186532 type:complete len:484 (+) Transcript_63128:275-1726(+)